MTTILDYVKTGISVEGSITDFDPDILQAINTACSELTIAGAVPTNLPVITNTSVTTEFGTEPESTMRLQYVKIRTRLIFDPPSLQFLHAALEKEALSCLNLLKALGTTVAAAPIPEEI